MAISLWICFYQFSISETSRRMCSFVYRTKTCWLENVISNDKKSGVTFDVTNMEICKKVRKNLDFWGMSKVQ